VAVITGLDEHRDGDDDGISLASRALFLIMWRRTGAEVADRRGSECGILP
jgi:hypothetical protein